MAFTLSTNPVVQKQQLADMMERSRKALAKLTAPVELRPDYKQVQLSVPGGMRTWETYIPPSSRFSSFRAGISPWNPGSD